MGADIDIALSMDDLEATDGAEEPVEAFFGLFTGNSKAKQEKDKQAVRDRFEAAKNRKSVDKIKAGNKNKNKPKTKAEEMAEKMKNIFRDDDDRPATTPSKQGGATIDLGFGGNPMERAARKYDTGTTETKKESGKVEDAYKGVKVREQDGFVDRSNRSWLRD